MPKCILKWLLSLSATSWMIVVYGIKEHWMICQMPAIITGIVLMLIPIVLSAISLLFLLFCEEDSLSSCKECVLADNEFLPVYLGYFFVSLSIPDLTTLFLIYLIVFVFTFFNHTLYFNPVFLLFGFHFYHVMTKYGTKIFLIVRGKVIRNAEAANFSQYKLKRINETTYLVFGRVKNEPSVCEDKD